MCGDRPHGHRCWRRWPCGRVVLQRPLHRAVRERRRCRPAACEEEDDGRLRRELPAGGTHVQQERRWCAAAASGAGVLPHSRVLPCFLLFPFISLLFFFQCTDFFGKMFHVLFMFCSLQLEVFFYTRVYRCYYSAYFPCWNPPSLLLWMAVLHACAAACLYRNHTSTIFSCR